MSEKTYKISAPLGTTLVPKDTMTEAELRSFASQLVQEADQVDVWKEKVAKDPIESVVEWLNQVGYDVRIS